MLTETWIVNPKIVNETRFQYTRNYNSQIGNLLPQINVSGAFTSGGANEGTNLDTRQHFELQNYTSICTARTRSATASARAAKATGAFRPTVSAASSSSMADRRPCWTQATRS